MRNWLVCWVVLSTTTATECMCLFDARYFTRAVEYMKFNKENASEYNYRLLIKINLTIVPITSSCLGHYKL